MKKSSLLFVFAFISVSGIAQSKIGTINLDYILAQMPQMTQVQEGLKAYNTELKTDLEESLQEFETLLKDYQENNTTMADSVKLARENELRTLENSIKGFQQKAGVLMQLKRNELTKPLYEIINEAMQKVIKEEGFTQIFNSGASGLAYSAEKFDITLKVLEEMGIEVKEEVAPAKTEE